LGCPSFLDLRAFDGGCLFPEGFRFFFLSTEGEKVSLYLKASPPLFTDLSPLPPLQDDLRVPQGGAPPPPLFLGLLPSFPRKTLSVKFERTCPLFLLSFLTRAVQLLWAHWAFSSPPPLFSRLGPKPRGLSFFSFAPLFLLP